MQAFPPNSGSAHAAGRTTCRSTPRHHNSENSPCSTPSRCLLHAVFVSPKNVQRSKSCPHALLRASEASPIERSKTCQFLVANEKCAFAAQFSCFGLGRKSASELPSYLSKENSDRNATCVVVVNVISIVCQAVQAWCVSSAMAYFRV